MYSRQESTRHRSHLGVVFGALGAQHNGEVGGLHIGKNGVEKAARGHAREAGQHSCAMVGVEDADTNDNAQRQGQRKYSQEKEVGCLVVPGLERSSAYGDTLEKLVERDGSQEGTQLGVVGHATHRHADDDDVHSYVYIEQENFNSFSHIDEWHFGSHNISRTGTAIQRGDL